MKIRTVLAIAALAGSGLLATAAPAAADGVDTYRVTFYTQDVNGAGTDATILLTVNGADGISPTENLDNDEDNFERGKLDRFGAFKWVNVGPVRSVVVYKGSNGSAWLPGWVQIHSESDNHTYTCSMGQAGWYGGGAETRTFSCS